MQKPEPDFNSKAEGQANDWSTPISVQRNLLPIHDVLKPYLELSQTHRILELASGFGKLMSHLARAFPHHTFQPSERNPVLLSKIRDEIKGIPNVNEVVELDILVEEHWDSLVQETGVFDLIVCNNLVHIAPWEVTERLFASINKVLAKSHGILGMYGPYLINGRFGSEGDRKFDEDIKSRDSRFGLRDVQDVADEARKAGLVLKNRCEMPFGNWLLIFGR